MKDRRMCVVLMAVVVALYSCGGEYDLVDYDDPIYYLGEDGQYYDTNPVALVVVDASRDGVVDLEDPLDLEYRYDSPTGYGALFLANLDDDGDNCPRSMSDEEFENCFDGVNSGIGGEADLADMARIKTAPTGPVPASAYGVLHVDEASMEYVRLYVNVGGGQGADSFELYGVGEDEIGAGALSGGVEFAIEGLALPGDPEVWDGTVEVTWEVHLPDLDRRLADRARLEMAPVLFPHHLQPASAVYAVDLGSRNDEFIHDLSIATAAAEIEEGLQLFHISDPWIQDYLLTGYMAMPGPEGPQVIELSFRSANLSYPGSLEEVYERIYALRGEPMPPLLRSAGRLVFTDFHGPGRAGRAKYDPDKGFDSVDTEGLDIDDVVAYLYGMNSNKAYPEVARLVDRVSEADTLDSFGNTETVPPHVAPDGTAYPHGRVFRGRGPHQDVRPDPTLSNLIDNQGVQPLIWLNTDWLLVKHVDETLSFIETDTPRGWSLQYNDPTRARDILRHLRDDLGLGDELMFRERYYPPNYDDCEWSGGGWDCPPPTPAQRTVAEVLDDEDIMAASARAAVEVDAQVRLLQAEVGIDDDELIPIGFLHEETGWGSVAYQPGIINGISLGPSIFGAPDPHGPTVEGEDPFIADVEQLLTPLGVDLYWIETWSPYHIGAGQVHCGSNTRRHLPDTPWWEKEQVQ